MIAPHGPPGARRSARGRPSGGTGSGGTNRIGSVPVRVRFELGRIHVLVAPDAGARPREDFEEGAGDGQGLDSSLDPAHHQPTCNAVADVARWAWSRGAEQGLLLVVPGPARLEWRMRPLTDRPVPFLTSGRRSRSPMATFPFGASGIVRRARNRTRRPTFSGVPEAVGRPRPGHRPTGPRAGPADQIAARGPACSLAVCSTSPGSGARRGRGPGPKARFAGSYLKRAS